MTHISDRDSDKATKKAISLSNNTRYEKIQADLKNLLPPSTSKMLIYASEKGASSWLTSLPLEKYGYVLSKQYFQDAICLRYNFLIPNRAVRCICGELNTVDHTLICKRGPFVNCRHNRLRDVIAALLNKCLPEVSTEPLLLPVTGESLPRGTTLQPGARLDILARGFYSPMERAFFDVRVSHPGAPTNSVFETPVEMYADHEDKKMKKYNHRVIQIEKGTFAPLCFSTTGGMGPQAMVFVKKLAKHMTRTNGQTLSNTMAYIRRTLRFELLKATLIAVRGHRGKYYEKALPIEEPDINLVEEASNDDV